MLGGGYTNKLKGTPESTRPFTSTLQEFFTIRSNKVKGHRPERSLRPLTFRILKCSAHGQDCLHQHRKRLYVACPDDGVHRHQQRVAHARPRFRE